jgi:hypothetical protein
MSPKLAAAADSISIVVGIAKNKPHYQQGSEFMQKSGGTGSR